MDLAHKRLGHISRKAIIHMRNSGTAVGLDYVDVREELNPCGDPNKVIRTPNVSFDTPTLKPAIPLQLDGHYDQMVQLDKEEPTVRRSARIRLNPGLQRYQNYHGLASTFVSAPSSEYFTPQTYQQAMQSTQSERWEQAIQKELESLRQHGVFSVVDLPADRCPLDGKYVFKIKEELDTDGLPLFKARFVGKGYQQIPGVDYAETFNLTLKMATLRIFLTLSASRRHTVRHYDVNTAFLNGDLDEDI